MAKSGNTSENSTFPNMKISRKNPVNSKKRTDSSMPIRSISKMQSKAKETQKTLETTLAIEPINNEVIDTTINDTVIIDAINNIKAKKALRLNMDSVKPQELKDKNVTTEIKYVKDNSVNQNSPFFYEPSIFEKFAIEVTDTDDDIVEDKVDDISETFEKEINEETTPISIFKSQEEIQRSNSNIIEEMLESIITENDNSENIEIKDEADITVEAADSIPVGKFFDSSTQNLDVELGFKPISDTVTPSSIFKSFTYEDDNTSIETTVENIVPVQKINVVADTITPAVTTNLDTKVEPIVENADVQTLLIPTVDIQEPNILDNSVDNTEVEIDYSSIITPSSDDISVDDISLEDLDISIDDLEINSISDQIDLVEDEIEDFNTTESVDTVIDELSDLTDEEVDELLTQTISSEEEITEDDVIVEDDSEIDYETIQLENEYNDDSFSIEDYFGLNDEEEVDSHDIEEAETEEFIENKVEETVEEIVDEVPVIEETPTISPALNEIKEFSVETDANQDITNLTEIIRNFTQTISTLNERITDLESGKVFNKEVIIEEPIEIDDSEIEIIDDSPIIEESIGEETEIDINNTDDFEEIDIDEVDLSDVDLSDIDLPVEEESLLADVVEESIKDEDLDSLLDDSDLIDALLSDEDLELEDEIISDEDLEKSLLEEMISNNISETDLLKSLEEDTELPTQKEKFEFIDTDDENILSFGDNDTEATSDLFKILDTLSKTIDELENVPESKGLPLTSTINSNLPKELQSDSDTFEDGKEINILMNKNDIFSISIINETYDIVADFDGISVLSENIHISTPKNNFYVKIGEKYIEIHNQKDQYLVQTNFEDVEFANAINNVAFAKKDNIIELKIKEAFKLSSVHNKIELSMLNSQIADINSIKTQEVEQDNDSSICDNKTLLISEETQKVYLPYTIEEVMKKLNDSKEYQSIEEVISKEYTLPLSTFKIPALSRFKEAYKFMREKENSSRYAAMDLGLELMFNSNLNPAIIRAAKDLKELNIYLDCLYENEVEKFDCFKIVYKVLPKIQ